MIEQEPQVRLHQSMTEEYVLTVVDASGHVLAKVPLGTNGKEEAKKLAERIIACVVVADGITDQS